MKKSILLSLAAMVLLASCEKEISVPEVIVNPDDATTVLRIGIPETKTTLGALDGSKRKVYWSDGDKIAVNGNESEALSGVAEGSTVAEFHFASPQAAPFNILYPASIWKDASTVTLPAEQAFVSGSFADGSCPMAGYSADGQAASLKYLCAVVKLPIKKASDSHNIASVSFASSGSEKVCGDFSINYENGTISGGSGSAVSVKVGQALSADAALDVYVVVPAATYASGFKLTITDVQNHEMVKAKEGSVTLEAGHIYNLEEVEFKPDIAPTVLNISSAEALIQLATAYNSGTYKGQTLSINMSSDVIFDATSSKAFAATGGIGSVDDGQGNSNYFNGSFNGNGKAIKNYTGNVPIFAYIGSSGVVKDLVIDSSCSYAFVMANEADTYFGTVAGYHKGVIDNVTVSAAVALADAANVESLTAIGGLVGRCTEGAITNCTFAGALEVPAGFSSTAKLLVGGIVGYTSNTKGVVQKCTFDGTIGVAAKVTSTDKTNPYMIVGGVVGYNSASVSECVTNDNPTVETLYSGAKGTIVIKTDTSYNTAVGGFVGENASGTVSSCENNASIFVTIFKAKGDASARYIRSGGIVGKNDANGVVSSCTNNATVQHRSNPRLQSLAGIVGHNSGTVTSCTNNAAVNHMTTGLTGATNKGGRIVNLAGVIGDNLAGAVVSDLHNTANIQISAMESNYDSDNDKPVCEVRMGGVVAYNFAELDGGASKSITNTGQVYFSPNFDKQFIGYEMGGIVGYSEASVQNVKNSGFVYFRWNSDANVASKVYLGGIVGKMAGDGTITGCVNEGGESNAGEVNIYVKKSTTAGHNNIFAGGILGYSENNVTISGCSNSGKVQNGNASRVNGTSCYTGGIVAYLKGASKILDCSNSGDVNSVHDNNNDNIGSCALTGGLAGHVEGTESDPVVIGGNTGCSVNSTLTATRGWIAGIAAYAKHVNISKCSVSQDINVACRGIGGLVGKAEYCTISSSVFNGDKVHANNVQVATGQGGIVGNLSNSTVDGCSCYATTLTNNVKVNTVGTIVGVSGDGNTIQNCHYKATITRSASEGGTESVSASIAGSGEFTDGGGNAADL